MSNEDDTPASPMPTGRNALRLHGMGDDPSRSQRKCLSLIVQPEGRLCVTAPNELRSMRMLRFAADLVEQGYDDCTWWKRQPEWMRIAWERMKVEKGSVV